ADRSRVAHAEVEPLGADRRDYMRRLADEGDARGGKLFGALHREREYAAPRLDRPLSEDRVGAAVDRFRQNVGRERGEAFRLVRLDHADEARTIARQRHDRERPSLGVELGRYAAMRTRVGKVERQRGLRIGEAVGADAGSGAAERVSPV